MFLSDISEFSLQSLRVFTYVVSLGSVMEAAKALGLSQPAVSLQIHNLERQLGFSLFDKQGRRNVLTARGQSFFKKLLPELEKLESVIVEAQEEADPRPELAIGSVEGIGEYWLFSRFKVFQANHEGVHFTLEIQDAQALEDLLITGRLSLIITPRKFEHPQIVSQVLMDERLLPVGKKKPIAALKAALENRTSGKGEWETMHWIGYGDTRSADPWTPRWLESVGVLVERHFRYDDQINSYSLIRKMLVDGRGICVAPEHTCEAELASGDLVALESKAFPALKNRLYVSHRDGGLNRVHQDFKEWLLEAASRT